MRPIRFTGHARAAMERRQLTEEDVRAVVERSDQLLSVRPGRVLAQSIREMGPADDRRVYFVRVILDVHVDGPANVVTAYRTTNISRYWRGVQ